MKDKNQTIKVKVKEDSSSGKKSKKIKSSKKKSDTKRRSDVNKKTDAKRKSDANRKSDVKKKNQDIHKRTSKSSKAANDNIDDLGTDELAREVKRIKKKASRNRELAIVSYMFVGLFVMLVGYFVYFNVSKADEVVNSPYNTRQDLFADRTIRGDIIDSDGRILAKTDRYSDGEEVREVRDYPYLNIFSHVVGYSSQTKGRSGLEASANFELLTSNAFFLEKIINDFKQEKNVGDTVVTTLDVNLQQAAYNALGDYDGAVVVLEPDTGKILAMVSKPDFDPNAIDSQWDILTGEDNNGSLYNRASQGSYPPGSTFKLITALAYMQQNTNYENYSYTCTGSIEVEGEVIQCYNGAVHGTQDLRQSLANSCNTSFVNMGLELDNKKFASLCSSLMFNNSLPVSMSYSKSEFTLDKNSSYGEIMQTAIGQGNTKVSPLHMALIVSAIANDGVLMNPYLVEQIENYTGEVVKTYSPTTYKELMTENEASVLSSYMAEVVNSGTGTQLSGLGYSVAGKTGSAEFTDESNASHSWFVGFSNVDNPDIVVCVIAVDAGTGSETAVPIARQVFDAYYY